MSKTKESLQHIVKGKVGSEFFFTHIESLFSQSLSIVGQIPGLKWFFCDLAELFMLFSEMWFHLLFQIFKELHRCRAILCHVGFQLVVCIVFESEQLCFLLPESENICDECCIVEGTAKCACGICMIDLLSEFSVICILHHWHVA